MKPFLFALGHSVALLVILTLLGFATGRSPSLASLAVAIGFAALIRTYTLTEQRQRAGKGAAEPFGVGGGADNFSFHEGINTDA